VTMQERGVSQLVSVKMDEAPEPAGLRGRKPTQVEMEIESDSEVDEELEEPETEPVA